MCEEELRRVVEPVHVLDDEQRGHHQQPFDQRRECLVASIPCAGRIERVDVRGRAEPRVERKREQRQPGGQVGGHGSDEERELLPGLVPRSIGRDSDQLPEKRPECSEWLSLRVRLAGHVELLEPDCEGARLGDETRLADARVGYHLDELQLAQPCPSDRVADDVELRVTSDDRARVERRARTAAGRLADGVGQDRGLLALDEQRLDVRRVRRARPVEDVRRREDRSGRCAGGQPRREIDRVAHDGVCPPRRRADVAGEDAPTVDAGPEGEPDVRAHDVTQRAEHRLLVLARRRRSACGEVNLRGVGVDVRLEPRQAVAPTGVRDDAGKRVETASHLFRIVVGGVGAGRLDERDGHLAMLGLAAGDGQVVAQRARDVGRKITPADGLGGGIGLAPSGSE